MQRKKKLHEGLDWLSLGASLVGLLVAGIWVNLVGYGGVFLQPAMTDSSFEAMRYAYHGGRVVVALSLVLIPSLYERKQNTLRLCIPLLMCFCTAAFALAYYQTLVPPFILACGASFVLGYSYLWVVASLYLAMARVCTLRCVIVVALMGQVLEQIVSVLANYVLPSWGQIFMCCVCPLVAMACLMVLGREHVVVHNATVCLSGTACSHTWLLLVVSGAATVALGAVSNVGVWGNARTDYLVESAAISLVHTALSCVILAVFAVTSLIPSMGKPLSYRYQSALLIVVGSFMLAALRPYVASSIISDCIACVLTAAEYFSHVLLWVIVMGAVKEHAGKPFAVAGVGLFSFSTVCFVWLFLLETNQNASIAFALALSYILIIVVAVHPRLLYERRRRRLTSSDALNEYTMDGEPEIPLESNGAAVAAMVERRCQLLGDTYHLSNRETQVLVLLAQGRSRPVIQERLVLSQGTVKTHLGHIYDKMNVSSHQEVLDLVYETGADAVK